MSLTLKRFVVNAVSLPFTVLGFVWQFISGGFMAGRILASQSVHKLALEVIAERLTGDALNHIKASAEKARADAARNKLN